MTNDINTDVTGGIPETPTFAESPMTLMSASTVNAELSVIEIELHPKQCKLKASTETYTSDNSSAINVNGDDKQATTSATIMSESTTTAKHILEVGRIESKTSDNSSATNITGNITAIETNQSSTTSEPASFTNYYQMFLNIRKQIHKKHTSLFPVQPKPPSGFEDYLMNRRTYLLDGNYKSRVVNTQILTPANLHKHLKNLFVEQEKERQKLRVQHIVEKEKLVLSVEQEILRVHGCAARALANQPLPFSVCTILKDNEVYNIMTPEQENDKDKHAPSCYNGRIFLSWLKDIDDKWEKIKIDLLLRQHNEAESLYAVQKMDWGWKLKEIQLCTYSSLEPNIDEEHVPIVQTVDKQKEIMVYSIIVDLKLKMLEKKLVFDTNNKLFNPSPSTSLEKYIDSNQSVQFETKIITASSLFKVNNIENVFPTSTQNNIIPPTNTHLPPDVICTYTDLHRLKELQNSINLFIAEKQKKLVSYQSTFDTVYSLIKSGIYILPSSCQQNDFSTFLFYQL